MKKALLTLITALALLGAMGAAVDREIFLYEDFSGTEFPPTGWTISSNAANWSRYGGANAGGSTPELRFSWTPQFNGNSYFISPVTNTAGETTMYVDFKHFVDFYDTPFAIGLATRSGGGNWNTVWSTSPTDDIGPELKTVQISNGDVGAADFQFAIYFSGSSYNIDYWYIDDVKLYTPFPYDLAVMDTDLPAQTVAGTPLTPGCIVKNAGLNTLTALVSLEILRMGIPVASYPDYYSEMLNPNQTQTVTFPTFTPAEANDLYSFHFSISSLEDVVDNDLGNNTLDGFVNTWTGDKQMVILEIGTGGWCPYCPGAAMAADDFIDLDYNVAVIENHNGDPYATDISNGRNAYYGISGYPTGIFDGVLSYVGGSNTTSVLPSYLPLYQQRNAVKAPLTLEIFGQQTREDYNLAFVMHQTAPIPYQNTVFHVAITESDIAYSWQGQDHFNFVNRMMYPGLEGTPWDLTQGTPGNSYTHYMTIAKDPNWVTANCELVAFYQNLDTKEIIQANKVMLADLIPVSAEDDANSPVLTGLGAIGPNPFADRVSIVYSVKEIAPVSVEVYNLKGQLVRNLVHDVKNAGTHSTSWDGNDINGSRVANGAYLLKLSDGVTSSVRKIMVIR